MLDSGKVLIVTQSANKVHKLSAVERYHLSTSVALHFYGSHLNLCGWLNICENHGSLVAQKVQSMG